MIYSRLISGLGNQLFQYAMGRQLALQRNVNLKLDISYFQGQDLRSFKLHHYNIVAEVADEKEVNDFLKPYRDPSLYYKFYRKIANAFPKYTRRYFVEEEWWVHEPDIFKTPADIYIDGYWQHYKYFEQIQPEIFGELTLNEAYRGDLAKLAADVSKNPSSISLHIRRGDYVTDQRAYDLMGVLPLSYYDQAINYMKRHLSDPHIYVFSDDLNWASENLKSDIPVTLMDIENGKKDYLELDIMSKCNHQIIANSSFSWWGAFLNQYEKKIVIAPKKWVVPDNRNSKIEIQLPTWIKI